MPHAHGWPVASLPSLYPHSPVTAGLAIAPAHADVSPLQHLMRVRGPSPLAAPDPMRAKPAASFYGHASLAAAVSLTSVVGEAY